MPTATIVFLEVGLPDEDTLPGQTTGSYTGSAQGGPENVVARYNKAGTSKKIEDKRDETINLVFGDGHVDTLPAKDVIDSTGKAYYPQLQQYNGLGKVSWTPDPEAQP